MEKKTITAYKYIANDWTEFEDEESCRIYENKGKIHDEWVEEKVYMHEDKWSVYEDLHEKYAFDENDEKLMWNLKHILSEVEIWIRLNTKTWEYEIISVDWVKLS